MWREMPQHGGRATDVIRVAMREDERVDGPHPECQQRGRHNALANVETGSRKTTGVDQHESLAG